MIKLYFHRKSSQEKVFLDFGPYERLKKQSHHKDVFYILKFFLY